MAIDIGGRQMMDNTAQISIISKAISRLERMLPTSKLDTMAAMWKSSTRSLHVIRRQEGQVVTIGTTVLPIGAIIGIAIAGSLMLFGVLAMVIMHCLRSRYKKKKQKRVRDLDLSDDNEDITEELRATGARTPYVPTHAMKDCMPKDWENGPNLYGSEPVNPGLVMPTYAFQITGLRDSWPLIGWVKTPAVHQLPVINPADDPKRCSSTAHVISRENDPTWPKRTFSRATTPTGNDTDQPVRWSSHSAKSSVNSFKIFPYDRRSVSDNQLSSILRSTSQRLRDAQRGRPASRSISVLSQASGAPPTMQPPSPPTDQVEESREALIDADDASCAESIRSSVLNVKSQDSSPDKIDLNLAIVPNETSRVLSLAFSDTSEPDSLCPSKTPDVYFPSPLTSPSKKSLTRGHSDKTSKASIVSANGSPTKASRERNQESHLSDEKENVIPSRPTSVGPHVENDPFVSSGKSPKSEFKPLSLRHRDRGPQSHHRNTGPDFKSYASRGLPLPLTITSGNRSKSMNFSEISRTEIAAKMPDDSFHWSTQIPRTSVLSLGQKPTGMKQKGHKRRRTVRLSHLPPRPVSVSVVVEEPENGLTPPRVEDIAEVADQNTRSAYDVGSPTSGTIYSVWPPSVAVFQPFLEIPPAMSRQGSVSSRRSSVADVSFYDCYSNSPEMSARNHSRVPDLRKSPSASVKKSRQHGRDFSIDGTRRLGLTPFPEVDLSQVDSGLNSFASSSPQSAPAHLSTFNVSSLPPTGPSTRRLYGPRSQRKSSASASIAASVSLLRRMNSQVSTSSITSDPSMGSPTLPALPRGGHSPTKGVGVGSMHYLRLGIESPNRNSKRGRLQEWEAMDALTRRYRASPPKEEEEREQGLGIKMPVIHNPTLRPLLLGTQSITPFPNARGPLPPQGRRLTIQIRPRQLQSSPISQPVCKVCKKALPFTLAGRDSGANPGAQWHAHCLVCTTCQQPLNPARAMTYSISSVLFCKTHYHARVHELSSSNPSSTIPNPSPAIGHAISSSSQPHSHTQERGSNVEGDSRWSAATPSPLTHSVRHESQMVMPVPQGSPGGLVMWRGSLGLYDERGFLRSSPLHGNDEWDGSSKLGRDGGDI